ncbi:MAG: oligosaccharide flippase family protein [Pseudomonadota bacterium]
MTPAQRIIFNTIAVYTRSLIAAGLALFSSRWVLNALGQTDYGLFCLVGSLIIFVAFINNVMASSAARHFAYAIGQGNIGEVNKWFNAALSTHLIIPILLVLLGWPIGELCIRRFLTIPPERIQACVWVFRFSLVSASTGMASAPFIAMFRAKQNIAELSIWEMLQAVLAFTIAWLLTQVSGDRLLFYAIGMVIVNIFVQAVQVCRSLFIFRECRIKYDYWFDFKRFKEIFNFASWSFIGILGGLLRNHGSNILLNLFFGPKANASYGIANQLSTQTGNLATAMFAAFSPEITASEGRGDRARMIALSHRASKFSTILVLLFAIPLIVEMHYILKLWLLEPPIHTALFCQLMIVTFLLDRLTAGYMSAINAYGKIAGYQATLGTILILTLPLAWLFIKLGYPPTSVGVAFVITMTICSYGRVLWLRHHLGVPIYKWLKVVVRPSLIVAVASITMAHIPRYIMPTSLLRLALVFFFSAFTVMLVTWFFGTDAQERVFIVESWRRVTRSKK